MSKIRTKLVNATYDRAYSLIQNDNMHKRFFSLKRYIHDDLSLTKEEKSEAIKRFDLDYDYFKVLKNDGIRRNCEICQERCLATTYCEFCIRNQLASKFSNWTSENDKVDNLIKKCQMETIIPHMIVEWIPYNNLQNIKTLTKNIRTADWRVGQYKDWDQNEKKLVRAGPCKVVLKTLENDDKANRTWIEEAITRLNIGNKWGCIVQCFGITKNPSNETYILVTSRMDINLRMYLLQNRNHITWKIKLQIIFEIIKAISRIHEEKYILKDLHSGNVLYSQEKNDWYINDLKFCGPADKPLNCIYGTLPYIAPEVIQNCDYSSSSDVYSLAILMWEIAAEHQPFSGSEHNSYLATDIINGLRPQIISETPSEIRDLIEQCWNSDPEKRPDIKTLWDKVELINKSIHQHTWNSNLQLSNDSSLDYEMHSKFYNFTYY